VTALAAQAAAGSALVPRAVFSVAPKRNFPFNFALGEETRTREKTSRSRDACATQTSAYAPMVEL